MIQGGVKLQENTIFETISLDVMEVLLLDLFCRGPDKTLVNMT